MIVNKLITTRELCYLNVQFKVARTVVFNNNTFRIILFSAHSVSNSTIKKGDKTIFSGY